RRLPWSGSARPSPRLLPLCVVLGCGQRERVPSGDSECLLSDTIDYGICSREFHDFACTNSSACSGASSHRAETPHTWLSPASLESHTSPVSLRHVRGFPALRLLRRLRPSSETTPELGGLPGFAD